MSVCSLCYNAGAFIESCASGLTFWTVTPDTSFLVCLQHNATGRVQTFPATSDEDGIITIEGIVVDALQGYTLFVTLGGVNGYHETITVDAVAYTCISFSIVQADTEPSIIILTD
jgi:hypothetical protein